jgi:two-component system cell cycle sensor histidine kinase/response regulator CckA
MATPLRVLLVEDSEDDAAIVVIELRRAGFAPETRRVDTRDEMVAALEDGTWDVVLCDHAMPAFNSARALDAIREKGLDVPLIIVSGMMGEDLAVEALKTGAADYVLKGSLRRLGPAVTRALRETEERRRLRVVEEGLRRNLERQRVILGAIPLALYTARTGGVLETTWISDNVERLSGFPAARFLAEPGLREARVHPEDLAARRKAFEGLAVNGTVAVEYRWQTADGRWRWFLDHATLEPGEAGRPAEAHGVWVDITDRRLLEQQLRQSQKMEAIGRLAGGVAHDFNNLLTVILGYSDLLLREIPDTHPGHGQIVEIRKAGQQASSLTRQLLAFSRRQVVEFKAVDLGRTVSDMEKMVGRLVGEDVHVRVKLDPRAGTVRADPGQMEQVLLNLVVNSRDAMPAGGSLVIETAAVAVGEGEDDGLGGTLRPGRFVRLSVTDNGTGIEPAARKRIFEPFFTTKPAGKGTGLGLATVQGIVVQSGGQISVRSEPGKGTTFHVLLPRSDAPAGAPEPPPAAAPRAAAASILVVEDEATIRDVVAATLRKAGYRVRVCDTAEAALAILLESRRDPVTLLLTDLVLPGMSGFELTSRLRSVCPSVRVLGMTGYIDREILDGARTASFEGLIQKPFRPEALLSKIAEAMAAGAPATPPLRG